jgi:hypothetical protein
LALLEPVLDPLLPDDPALADPVFGDPVFGDPVFGDPAPPVLEVPPVGLTVGPVEDAEVDAEEIGADGLT